MAGGTLEQGSLEAVPQIWCSARRNGMTPQVELQHIWKIVRLAHIVLSEAMANNVTRCIFGAIIRGAQILPWRMGHVTLLRIAVKSWLNLGPAMDQKLSRFLKIANLIFGLLVVVALLCCLFPNRATKSDFDQIKISVDQTDFYSFFLT